MFLLKILWIKVLKWAKNNNKNKIKNTTNIDFRNKRIKDILKEKNSNFKWKKRFFLDHRDTWKKMKKKRKNYDFTKTTQKRTFISFELYFPHIFINRISSSDPQNNFNNFEINFNIQWPNNLWNLSQLYVFLFFLSCEFHFSSCVVKLFIYFRLKTIFIDT